MINSIIESISISLNVEFGEDYTIYTESVEQGLKEPCFFIFCINSTSELSFRKRYFRENQFGIEYHPVEKEQAKKECNEVAERLFLCLEFLTVTGDLMMGTKMKYEVVDGILNFFVNYNQFVYRADDATPSMEELTEAFSVKR